MPRVVISDTSPLRYLVLIGHAELLCALYAEALIPEAVLNELISERGLIELARISHKGHRRQASRGVSTRQAESLRHGRSFGQRIAARLSV